MGAPTNEPDREMDEQQDRRTLMRGVWSLKTEARYEKLDANKVKFVLPLKPREKQQFPDELTTNYGANVTR